MYDLREDNLLACPRGRCKKLSRIAYDAALVCKYIDSSPFKMLYRVLLCEKQ